MDLCERILELEQERVCVICELDDCWLKKKSLVEYELLEQMLRDVQEHIRRLRKEHYLKKCT